MVPAEQIEYEEPEPEICSYFGCRKILSLQEKLSGSRCINHPKTIKTFHNGKL